MARFRESRVRNDVIKGAIAGAVDSSRDPRDVIADIVQLNDLAGGRVMPGQQLFVPSR